jgi:hypothetical protein
MKKLITYCLFLSLSTIAFSQPVGWTFDSTSKPKTFSFTRNNLFLIDGQFQTPSKGDYIGVFTQINNVEKCVGYTAIDTNNFIVTAFGKATDSSLTGYQYNSTFRVRWWSAIRNCQVVVDYTDSTSRLDSNATFTIIKIISTSIPSVSYSKSFYNIQTDINPSPVLIGISIADLKFNSKTLDLDTSKGVVNLKNSPLGVSTINFSSQYCLSNYSFNITIKDSIPPVTDSSKAPILDNLAFNLLSPGCKTLGSIHFKENTIKGKMPFVFQLSTNYSPDIITNTNGKFDELREGNYQLTVRDSTGKETKYEKTISLIKQGDCTSSVLAPNSKDGLQAIFISETGTANILNRDGALIKRLTIPAEWDGRDSNGSDVPMGDYYLFINEQQSKVITVIR